MKLFSHAMVLPPQLLMQVYSPQPSPLNRFLKHSSLFHELIPASPPHSRVWTCYRFCNLCRHASFNRSLCFKSRRLTRSCDCRNFCCRGQSSRKLQVLKLADWHSCSFRNLAKHRRCRPFFQRSRARNSMIQWLQTCI